MTEAWKKKKLDQFRLFR